MLDLAIAIDTDTRGITMIETNRGPNLKSSRWPQDCDFQLVAFSPLGKTCDVVWTELLAEDISRALKTLTKSGVMNGLKPDWYRRLARCAQGASISTDLRRVKRAEPTASV
jgi:hypothetical protein